MNHRYQFGWMRCIVGLAVAALMGGCGRGGDSAAQRHSPASPDAQATGTTALAASTAASEAVWTESYGEAEKSAQALTVMSSLGDWVPVVTPSEPVSTPGGDGAPVLLFRAQSNKQLVGGVPRCEGGALRAEQALPLTYGLTN
jgi:hypothetical protein